MPDCLLNSVLHGSSGISSIAHHSQYINVFVVYPLLCRNSSSTKSTSSSFFPWVTNHDRSSYYSYSYSRGRTSLNLSIGTRKGGVIPTRKGKYPVLRTNTKPQQLIKHTKISESIASLVFRQFLYVTYRNGLNGGTSKPRHSKYLKKYEAF